MIPYKTKSKPFTGTRYFDISSKAFYLYNQLKKKSKRRPYVRSAYFKKEKIFIELFWKHLLDKKNFQDKARRLKYFPCALELIEKSRVTPVSEESFANPKETLYRFYGVAPGGLRFVVQIKEDKKKKRKWLMSVFPAKLK